MGVELPDEVEARRESNLTNTPTISLVSGDTSSGKTYAASISISVHSVICIYCVKLLSEVAQGVFGGRRCVPLMYLSSPTPEPSSD